MEDGRTESPPDVPVRRVHVAVGALTHPPDEHLTGWASGRAQGTEHLVIGSGCGKLYCMAELMFLVLMGQCPTPADTPWESCALGPHGWGLRTTAVAWPLVAPVKKGHKSR